MVHGFHSDYHEKLQSGIPVHSFLHHIEIHGPCQTLSIFPICFLGLSRHHGSQKINQLKMKRLETQSLKNVNQVRFLPNFLMKMPRCHNFSVTDIFTDPLTDKFTVKVTARRTQNRPKQSHSSRGRRTRSDLQLEGINKRTMKIMQLPHDK